MRFGRRFHTHVVPEWVNTYIDYNRFKSQLKLETRLQGKQHRRLVEFDANSRPDFSVPLKIDAAAAAARSFYISELDRTSEKVERLLESVVSVTADSTQFTAFEFVSMLAECLDLRNHVLKLCWYVAVNGEGLNRLRSKYRKLNGSLNTSSLDFSRFAYAGQSKCAALLNSLLHALSAFDLAQIRQSAMRAALPLPQIR